MIEVQTLADYLHLQDDGPECKQRAGAIYRRRATAFLALMHGVATARDWEQVWWWVRDKADYDFGAETENALQNFLTELAREQVQG